MESFFTSVNHLTIWKPRTYMKVGLLVEWGWGGDVEITDKYAVSRTNLQVLAHSWN